MYREIIRTLSQQYGSATWFIVYQADVRMRSEEFERIRRRCDLTWAGSTEEQRRGLPYDPSRPWDLVFSMAASDKDFWDARSASCTSPGSPIVSAPWTTAPLKATFLPPPQSCSGRAKAISPPGALRGSGRAEARRGASLRAVSLRAERGIRAEGKWS